MLMPDFRTLVPHSGAMALLDRVVSADDETLSAEVRIRADSMFCGAVGVGAWAGIEYMAQAVAAHAGYIARLRGEPVKIGFLLGSRRYECSRPMFDIGSVLRVHARRVLQGENGLGSFECWIDAGEQRIATAIVNVFQPDNANDFLKEPQE
jgi:3-oxoacyl-[acyl-carrier-protein] synthase-1